MSIVTIDMLLGNKKKIEEESNKKLKLQIAELGGEILIRKITLDEFIEHDKDSDFVYIACVEPNFKEEKLIEKTGSKLSPSSVVEKVLTAKTIRAIAREILEFSDLKEINGENLATRVENDIKN